MLWRPQPLEIEVAITDESGVSLPPSQVLNNLAESPFEVKVISPAGKTFGPLALGPDSVPGHYLAQFDDYTPFIWYTQRDLGWYEVRVQLVGKLKETYIYDKPDGEASRVHFSRHPLWWVLPAILGVLFIMLLAYTAYQTYLRLWSAEGTLTIEGAGSPWIRRLRDYGQHTVTFSGRDSLPAGINKITVHQPQGQRNPPVEVAIQLRKGAKTRQRLVDGARKPLGGGVFVNYARGLGAGSGPKISISPTVLLFGVAALLMLLAIGGIIFAVVSSLG
jgi:hypothetical protein